MVILLRAVIFGPIKMSGQRTQACSLSLLFTCADYLCGAIPYSMCLTFTMNMCDQRGAARDHHMCRSADRRFCCLYGVLDPVFILYYGFGRQTAIAYAPFTGRTPGLSVITRIYQLEGAHILLSFRTCFSMSMYRDTENRDLLWPSAADQSLSPLRSCNAQAKRT